MSGDVDFWARLVLASLATWRLTHLLVREDGPAELIARVRTALDGSPWGRALGCFYCTSLWVAAPLSLWVSVRSADAWIAWLALSAAACLVERIGQPDVVVQPVAESNDGESDGMLRTAADGASPPDAGFGATGR